MSLRAIRVTLGAGVIAATCTLSSCGDSSGPHRTTAHRSAASSSTTTTEPVTQPTPAPSTLPPVAVPNVIGLRIQAAHTALRLAGLRSLSLNTACNEGTLASQSVVVSLVLPGSPAPRVGATPINPGALVPRNSAIGLTWSGCYGTGSVVPNVVGTTFAAARRAIEKAGLRWACYSLVAPHTPASTTTRPPSGAPASHPTVTTASTSTTSTTTTTTTTTPTPGTVARVLPAAGSTEHPGTIVSIFMARCPQ